MHWPYNLTHRCYDHDTKLPKTVACIQSIHAVLDTDSYIRLRYWVFDQLTHVKHCYIRRTFFWLSAVYLGIPRSGLARASSSELIRLDIPKVHYAIPDGHSFHVVRKSVIEFYYQPWKVGY
jgi:hypothetical protein